MKKSVIAAALLGLTLPFQAWAGDPKEATLYKDPQCGCCEGYADYLRASGFKVTVVPTHDLPLINQEHNVPEQLEGCHTMLIGGYVVEGHVPVDALNRLLTEKPHITGISLPGMPQGSPGMYGAKTGPFTVYAIVPGTPKVFATE